MSISIDDFLKIEKIVNNTVDERLKPVEEKISHFPTKEEFFSRMDELSGQIKKVQESFDLHQGSHEDLSEKDDELDDRLTTVEKRLGIPHQQ